MGSKYNFSEPGAMIRAIDAGRMPPKKEDDGTDALIDAGRLLDGEGHIEHAGYGLTLIRVKQKLSYRFFVLYQNVLVLQAKIGTKKTVVERYTKGAWTESLYEWAEDEYEIESATAAAEQTGTVEE